MTLDQVRHLAASLPEVTEEPHFQSTSFRVRGKIFATAPPEGEYLHVFVDAGRRERALGEAPDFLEELHWGGQVRGLRVLLPRRPASRGWPSLGAGLDAPSTQTASGGGQPLRSDWRSSRRRLSWNFDGAPRCTHPTGRALPDLRA